MTKLTRNCPKCGSDEWYARQPKLPNYLLFENELAGKIDVADITDESLKEIGGWWTAALVAHAQARRANKRGGNVR